MKIAVCFSGQLSRFNINLHVFKEQLAIYAKHSIDLFFSFWGNEDLNSFHKKIEDNIKPEFKNNINIRNVELIQNCEWKSKHPNSKCWSRGNSAESIICMYKSIKNADILRQNFEKQNNLNYDLVIRSRPDILISGDIDFEKWKHKLDSEKIAIIPKNYNWCEQWSENGMLCDLWFVAKPKAMEEICKIADLVDDHVDSGCRLHPESLLWWQIEKHVNISSFFQTNNIIRPLYSFEHCEVILHRNGNAVKYKDKSAI